MLKITKLFLLVVFGVFVIFCFSDSVSATCSVSMVTSGSVNLNLSATNRAGVATSQIKVETDCGGGYYIAIGSSSDDSTLYLDGDDTSDFSIETTSGTTGNPSAIYTLNNNIYENTWGYSILTNTTADSNNFVGLTNGQTTIFDKDTISEDGGDFYSVYYGASVGEFLPAGTYKMADDATVVYYLVARSLDFEVTGNPTTWTNQSATLTVISANADRISQYSFDGGLTWQDSPSKTYDTNSDVEIKVKNSSGWVSPGQIVNITKIDKVAPALTFDNDTEYNGDHTTKQVTTLITTLDDNTSVLTGVNVSDSLSGIADGWPKCYRNDVEISSTNAFTSAGRYGITCVVQDNAGNETEEDREVLVRWPLAGKYVVKRQGYVGTGLSSTVSSDGLYMDTVATGADATLPFASKYYYTGPSVNNYIDFAGTTFRILNIPTNDDIKVIGAISDQSTAWGDSKIYDSNVYKTWSTKWWPRGQLYNNETGENSYKLLTTTEKAHLDLATFYAGRIDKDEATDISQTIYYEQNNAIDLGGNNSASFEGYSAYPNASDFLKASKAHDVIDSIGDIDTTSVYSRRQTFTNNSWVDMTAEFWTMNGRTGTLLQDNDFWVIDNDLGGHFEARLYSNTQQYRVVFYLKNDTILSGTGTSLDPFSVEEDWAWFDSTQVLQ